MIRYHPTGKKIEHHTNEITALMLLFASLFILFSGIEGIIEYKSPAELSTVWTLTASFFDNIKYHILILIGAFTFTASVWLASKGNKD